MHTVMAGTVPTGGALRRVPRGITYAVVDRWQDMVTIQSSESQRTYRIPDTEYVYVKEED